MLYAKEELSFYLRLRHGVIAVFNVLFIVSGIILIFESLQM